MRLAAGLVLVVALVAAASGTLLAQPNPSPEPAPAAITPPPAYFTPPPIYTPPPPLGAPTPSPAVTPSPGESPNPAPSGSPSPAPSGSAVPVPSAAPTVNYHFVYNPSPAPSPTGGAPAIFEFDVNDQSLQAPGPLNVRVLTTPEVATVTMTMSVYGRNVQIQIPKSAAPGVFQLDDKLPGVPSFIKGRNYNVAVTAAVPDGRTATINITLGLAR